MNQNQALVPVAVPVAMNAGGNGQRALGKPVGNHSGDPSSSIKSGPPPEPLSLECPARRWAAVAGILPVAVALASF